MVVLNIYRKTLHINYKTTLWSKATLFVIATTLFNILFPYLLAYRSRGFWLKNDIFHEQPDVRFKATYLLQATTTNPNYPIVCSNYPYFYSKYNHMDHCNSVKVQEFDYNFDGKVDEVDFSISLDLPDGTKLLMIELMLPLQYKLHTLCQIELETAAILQQILPTSTVSLHVVSELGISQTAPLKCNNDIMQNLYNELIKKDDMNVESFLMENIINSYTKRNVSTHLTNIYTSSKIGSGHQFSLKLKIRYPIHRVYYKTSFWQMIKWAWIQYISIYIITFYVIKTIKDFVFDNRLVLFYRDTSDVKKNL